LSPLPPDSSNHLSVLPIPNEFAISPQTPDPSRSPPRDANHTPFARNPQ
jgi:hypothetical protein